LQGGEAQRIGAPPVVHEAMRTTMHLPPTLRTALKRRALDRDTTMSELIRAAISSGLQDPAALAGASMKHRRTSGGALEPHWICHATCIGRSNVWRQMRTRACRLWFSRRSCRPTLTLRNAGMKIHMRVSVDAHMSVHRYWPPQAKPPH
jgi:hypothetical protein